MGRAPDVARLTKEVTCEVDEAKLRNGVAVGSNSIDDQTAGAGQLLRVL